MISRSPFADAKATWRFVELIDSHLAPLELKANFILIKFYKCLETLYHILNESQTKTIKIFQGEWNPCSVDNSNAY